MARDDRPRVLVTVSGAIPHDLDEQVARGERPRADYRVIAERLDADVVDVEAALEASGRVGRVGRVVARLGAGPLLAWYTFRHRRDYDVVLTDGEQVGIPLALLTRLLGRGGCRHVMIVHILSVPKKSWVMRAARLAPMIDRYVVYCTSQREFVTGRLGVAAADVVVSSFMVDTDFFRPVPRSGRARPLICSAGLERRDYPTMMRAVDGLDVDVVIAAASPWSKQDDSTEGVVPPSNVAIRRLDLAQLRALYAECSLVVMPLLDVDFQAGITTILEAMAMGLPVVCTRTPGQTDTIQDGVTGRYVPPQDADALRSALVDLLGDERAVDGMGRAARAWAVDVADVDRYADRIAGVVSSTASPGSGRTARP